MNDVIFVRDASYFFELEMGLLNAAWYVLKFAAIYFYPNFPQFCRRKSKVRTTEAPMAKGVFGLYWVVLQAFLIRFSFYGEKNGTNKISQWIK